MENYIQYRRDLHQIPEVARQEFKTSEYVGAHLAKLHCQVEKVCGTGYTAFFDNGAEDTIAFRGDMDALSIKEETGLKSRCIPFGEEPLGETCVCCGRPAKKLVYWGRQY